MQEKLYSQFELIKLIPEDENKTVSDVSVPHLIVFEDMLGENEDKKKKNTGLQKKDIIVMKVRYTSHKICS